MVPTPTVILQLTYHQRTARIDRISNFIYLSGCQREKIEPKIDKKKKIRRRRITINNQHNQQRYAIPLRGFSVERRIMATRAVRNVVNTKALILIRKASHKNRK